jgi:hypothetical protein
MSLQLERSAAWILFFAISRRVRFEFQIIVNDDAVVFQCEHGIFDLLPTVIVFG